MAFTALLLPTPGYSLWQQAATVNEVAEDWLEAHFAPAGPIQMARLSAASWRAACQKRIMGCLLIDGLLPFFTLEEKTRAQADGGRFICASLAIGRQAQAGVTTVSRKPLVQEPRAAPLL